LERKPVHDVPAAREREGKQPLGSGVPREGERAKDGHSATSKLPEGQDEMG